ncbi:uncharacterized protein LOC133341749 isoform X2 [Lethenteron reissneri]|uniref:uncharacterized protein LOC133341749 isoform X2 n=1 Tax=Lethenteron reissneri TaxID=7753 RepID=UPI002AB77D05|nr:uncharacterized protein LOC133341749 isoform X2 [Lethenteron reissneri]
MGKTKQKRPKEVQSLTMEAFCTRKRSKAVPSEALAQVAPAKSPDHSQNLNNKDTGAPSSENHGPDRKANDPSSSDSGSRRTSGPSRKRLGDRRKHIWRKTHRERNHSSRTFLQRGASKVTGMVAGEETGSKRCQATLHKPSRKEINERGNQAEPMVVNPMQRTVLCDMQNTCQLITQNTCQLITQNRLTQRLGLFSQMVESKDINNLQAQAAVKPSKTRGAKSDMCHRKIRKAKRDESLRSTALQSKVIVELIKSPSEFLQMESVSHSTPLSSARDRASLCSSLQGSQLAAGHAERAHRNSKACEEPGTDERATKTRSTAESLRSHTGVGRKKKKNKRHKHQEKPELTRDKEKMSCCPKETGGADNECIDSGYWDTDTVSLIFKAAKTVQHFLESRTYFPDRRLALEHRRVLVSCIKSSQHLEGPSLGRMSFPGVAPPPTQVIKGPDAPNGAPPPMVQSQRGFFERGRETSACYQMSTSLHKQEQAKSFLHDHAAALCPLPTMFHPAAVSHPTVMATRLPNFQPADVAAGGGCFENVSQICQFLPPAGVTGFTPKACDRPTLKPYRGHQSEVVRCENFSRRSRAAAHSPEDAFVRDHQPCTSNGHFSAFVDSCPVHVARQPDQARPREQFPSNGEFAFKQHDMCKFHRGLSHHLR